MPRPHSHSGPAAHSSGALVGHGRGRHLLGGLLLGGRRRRNFERLGAASGVRPGDRVLDVGCGTGNFTRLLARAVAPGGRAHGVDPDEDAITRARQRTKDANCTFASGIGQALDAPDGSYDVVVSSLALHHLPEAQRPQAMREMFRVLRPGGRVLIAEFRPPKTRLVRGVLGTIHDPTMVRNELDRLPAMLRDAGFAQPHTADLRPWVHYVLAHKPAP